MADEPTFYWDACILLEHFREEVVTPAKKRAIQRLLADNKGKQNRLVTSVITHVEVLPKKLTLNDETKEAQYWSYYDGKWFLDIEASRQVVSLARMIKDYYFVQASGDQLKDKIMSTGDALHLATAIIYKVDEFHTRDGNRKGGNVPLIGLPESSPNGKICGQWPLKILSPEDPTTELFDWQPNDEARPS
jgi:predicted nucleic acid-binding protein